MDLPRGPIDKAALAPRTGAGTRVVIIDSGVHERHPHVGGVSGGEGFDARGHPIGTFTDRLGHGTAVTAVVREKAPDAEILVARVFEDRLETTLAALEAALGWALAQEAHLVNLSLGTATPAHAPALQAAVHALAAAGAWVVAAGSDNGVAWLPGTLDGVIAVSLDWSLHRDQAVVDLVAPAGARVRASGLPRPIPGVPPERNLKGVSFAVANVTGLLALWREGGGRGVGGPPR